jgi:hypothetical protein
MLTKPSWDPRSQPAPVLGAGKATQLQDLEECEDAESRTQQKASMGDRPVSLIADSLCSVH